MKLILKNGKRKHTLQLADGLSEQTVLDAIASLVSKAYWWKGQGLWKEKNESI
jgi:hypothetical protein